MRLKFLIPVAAVCMAVSTYSTLAGTVRISDGDAGSGSGGQFKIDQATDFAGLFDSTGDSFQTFCVERNETISLGGTYEFEISTSAINGGVGGPSPDPLGSETAYLYTQFREGLLDGIVAGYSYNDDASANALQDAIWYLEEELALGSLGALALDLVDAANDAVTSGAWVGIGRIRILRLFNVGPGGNKQDQLTMIPLPAPVGMAIVGLVGVGIAFSRRRN